MHIERSDFVTDGRTMNSVEVASGKSDLKT